MEQSPLELYRTAYNLHYKKKEIAEACEIYQRLLEEFPESDAAGYAAIQLQKIKSSEIALDLGKRSGSAGGAVRALLIINLVLTLGIGGGGYYLLTHIHKQVRTNALLTRVIGKMATDQDEDALELLTDVKIRVTEDITPFALSADILRRHHKFAKARAEYEAFQRLYPDNPLPRQEIDKINREEDAYIKKEMEENTRATEKKLPEQVVEEAEKKRTIRNRSPRRRPASKPKVTLPPDVEYF